MQIIGVVVADTEAHARAAAKAVAVQYEELPALISIEDAIEAGSFYEVRCAQRPRAAGASRHAALVLSSTCCMPSSRLGLVRRLLPRHAVELLLLGRTGEHMACGCQGLA